VESGENCTAVLLFPTKALAQDQLQTMQRYLTRLAHELASADDGGRSSSRGETPRFHCATLDGDTSFADRGDLQRTATVILTNPDTLHASILPRHKDHQRLLSGLRYIVIDEVR
jgi:DEAD/DEAH box helicase domain-containing protein